MISSSRNVLAGSFPCVFGTMSLGTHDLASEEHSSKLVKLAILYSVE